MVSIFGEDNLRYLLLWIIFYSLYSYFLNITLLSLICLFLIGLMLLKAAFICILAFTTPVHNNPIHKAESRALAQDGIVDSAYDWINGCLTRLGQMIRNTSVIELILVGVLLYLLKLLFKSTSNSFAIFLTVVLSLLAEGLYKILGPSVSRVNNWFDSSRENALNYN